jgi:hypothetical protein
MLEDTVYENISDSLRELKENKWWKISVIQRQFHCVSEHFFSRCETCRDAEGQNFKTIL